MNQVINVQYTNQKGTYDRLGIKFKGWIVFEWEPTELAENGKIRQLSQPSCDK